MSNAIQSLGVLHNNPFILSPIFPAFFDALGKKDDGLLLSYLVLPLVLPPTSRLFLVNAKSTSSLMTFAGRPGKRDRLYGLEERIQDYRDITNITVQLNIDNEVLLLCEGLSLKALTQLPDSLCPPNTIKSARRLGLLFKPFDVPSIYRMLGVKKL